MRSEVGWQDFLLVISFFVLPIVAFEVIGLGLALSLFMAIIMMMTWKKSDRKDSLMAIVTIVMILTGSWSVFHIMTVTLSWVGWGTIVVPVLYLLIALCTIFSISPQKNSDKEVNG